MSNQQTKAEKLAAHSAYLSGKLRITPMPSDNLIPHLQACADELRRLVPIEQELERMRAEIVDLEKAVNHKDAYCEHLGRELFSAMAENESLRQQLAVQPAAKAVRQYYYRNNLCKAADAYSIDCICWYDEGTGPIDSDAASMWRDKPILQPAAQGEPVGTVVHTALPPGPPHWSEKLIEVELNDGCDLPDGAPVYANPQPTSKPLTDEQIEDGWLECDARNLDDFITAVRFAEREHKIGGAA